VCGGREEGSRGTQVTGPGDLRAVLREHYRVRDPDPQQLPHSWEGNTFHQPRPNSAGWVVRVVPADRAIADAVVLSFLEQARYPAPRLIRSVDGKVMVPYGSQSVLVTTFVPGSPADLSTDALYGLGQRLGHLHSLMVPAAPDLPSASMLPASDMATALSWLRPLGPLPSPELQDMYRELVAAIGGIDPGWDLPRTLIHNDAHPGRPSLHSIVNHAILSSLSFSSSDARRCASNRGGSPVLRFFLLATHLRCEG
jgi:Ser/Thr protein kinase RdoA (MazF antagonist)